jgi:prepilin-type N-terminal cleavage/methylation domain-containing protein
MNARSEKQSGFTLLEIVVTLILASILGTILAQFVHTAAQQSVQPIVMIKSNMSLSGVVEKMNADYRKNLLLSSTPLADFKTEIESGKYGEDSRQISWIRFNASQVEEADTSGDNRIMKVTVTKQGRSATMLYTK